MSAFTPTPRPGTGHWRAARPAGARRPRGTGKTEVIARRYLQLLQLALAAAPGRILVLTFSEKAAAEMRARIFRAVSQAGLGFERLDLAAAPISTFHSFCARLLGDHSLRARIDPRPGAAVRGGCGRSAGGSPKRFLAAGFREAYGDFDPLTVDGSAWEDGKPFGVAQALIDQAPQPGHRQCRLRAAAGRAGRADWPAPRARPAGELAVWRLPGAAQPPRPARL